MDTPRGSHVGSWPARQSSAFPSHVPSKQARLVSDARQTPQDHGPAALSLRLCVVAFVGSVPWELFVPTTALVPTYFTSPREDLSCLKDSVMQCLLAPSRQTTSQTRCVRTRFPRIAGWQEAQEAQEAQVAVRFLAKSRLTPPPFSCATTAKSAKSGGFL